MGLDCSVSDRKGCNYCLRGKIINTNGDAFSITEEKEDEKYFLSTEGAHFFLMDIRYCPICGKKLIKK